MISMTNRDLMAMGFNNLKRRKMRTFLTVLGVVIGASSIMVMLSLGIGMNRNFMGNMERMGSLNVIEVSPEYNYEEGASSDRSLLDDTAVDSFKTIDGVEGVMPMLNKHVLIKAGRKEAYVTLYGIDFNQLEAFEFNFEKGSPPDGYVKNQVIFGSSIKDQFFDPKSRNPYQNMETVNLMETPLKLIPQEMNSNGQRPRGINISTAGILEVSQGQKDWSAYMSIHDLEKIYEDINRRAGNRDRRQEEDKYQSVKVKVADMNVIDQVSDSISQMGFRVWSLKDMLDGMKKTYAGIQAVLGGIGGVSLFVAAIGITNTMVMSIYERTKEIGIMKVIGAELKDIKRLFLFEAAMIGFIGGIIGMGLSFGVSHLINQVAGSFMGGQGMGIQEVSYIPLWLYLSALAFSTFVGILAGYYPARKAMKLSVLEAIRTE